MADMLQQKLDLHGRRQLAQGDPADLAEVLIRTAAPITHEQQAELEQAGCEIRSIVGNVLSGVVMLANLAALANLQFVRKIELSRRLYQEERPEEQGDAP
jgi:hypothetical protein